MNSTAKIFSDAENILLEHVLKIIIFTFKCNMIGFRKVGLKSLDFFSALFCEIVQSGVQFACSNKNPSRIFSWMETGLKRVLFTRS